MGKIYRDVVVLGINPEREIRDPEARDVEYDKRPMIKVIPVTMLKDVDGVSKENGIVGEKVEIMKYNCPSVEKEILKFFKPNAKLLLHINQTIIGKKGFDGKDNDKAGEVYEKVISVLPALSS